MSAHLSVDLVQLGQPVSTDVVARLAEAVICNKRYMGGKCYTPIVYATLSDADTLVYGACILLDNKAKANRDPVDAINDPRWLGDGWTEDEAAAIRAVLRDVIAEVSRRGSDEEGRG